MKKYLSVAILIVFIVTLAACNASKKPDISKLEKSAYDASQQNTQVALTVKEKAITPETGSITLIYANLSDKQYIFGKEPHLEVEADGKWYVIPTLKGVAWEAIAYLLRPNESREDPFDIKNYYSRLDAGKYRIVKTLSGIDAKTLSPSNEETFIIAEFQIQ